MTRGVVCAVRENYHPMMKKVHDSAINRVDRTTQYMSHGASEEGSPERSALNEAKIGRRIVMIELRQS